MSNSPALQRRVDQFQREVTVYPVSCEKLANGRSDLEWLEGVIAGGCRIVQLRDKISSDNQLFQKALAFRQITSEAGVLLIINNRVDIALAVDADGVHLGNSDFPALEARKLAPDLIIGVSANTEEQAKTVDARGASYFNIGPIFPTKTKEGLSSFLGAEAIQQFAQHSTLPHTIMGGIKFEHIAPLVQAGAQRLAVVTAISQAPDIAAETQKWITAINNAHTKKP